MTFASPASTTLDELVQLRAQAVALRRRPRRSAAPMAGMAVSRRLGRGLDFAEVREYQPGDDVRQIDWNVTARTQRPHTKLFVEELERPVHLVVDGRSAMRFGTRGCYKSVMAARLASLVGWSTVAAHDRVGGLVFADGWHTEIRPDSGRRGLMGLFRAIVQAQNRVPGGGESSLARTFERLATVAHPGCSIRIFSDFSGFDAAAARALGGSLSHTDLLAVQIVDPLDRDLPAGRALEVAQLPGRGALSNGVDAAVAARLTIGAASQRARLRARFDRQQAALDKALSRGRHRHVTVGTEQPLIEAAWSVLHPGPARAATRRSVRC